MLSPRLFTPENRLEVILGDASDPTTEALVDSAERRLGDIGDDLRAYVADQHRIILDIAEQPEEIVFAQSRTLGEAALAICEVAGAAGLHPLGEAARGVYAMVGALLSHGVWHTEALNLHIDALAQLSAEMQTPPWEADQILERLKTMRHRIGVPD